MARARNIKPGFFRNADLVELPVEARLLFVGLWTLADRDGRLEDRPKQIKMEIFPADSFDVGELLSELAGTDMLERYEVGGKKYIQIVNFTKHQNPHRDEKASTIPAPGSIAHIQHPVAGEHGASTVLAPCEHCANTVAIGLIPDSLIPDSLIPESKTPAQPASNPVQARERKPSAVAADRFDAAEFLIEKGADQQTVADYLTLRKGKKAASTATALRQIVAEAEKAGMSLQKAIEICCTRGWVGFKAEWAESHQARAGPIARHEKFDPVAHVNRNRTTTQRHESADHNVIDITPECVA